jgi:glycine cleavage system H protein
MFKVRPHDMAEVDNLIHGAEAVEKWLLEEIEKYKKD